MWPNLPPQGLPLSQASLPVDIPQLATMVAVAIILVCGAFAFVLARLIVGRRELWVVRCPIDQVRAVCSIGQSTVRSTGWPVARGRGHLGGQVATVAACA